LNIINLDINTLTPYKNNAKKHPKKQVEQITNSIKEFGMIDPIGIWGKDNIIVEGHGRYLACKKLGIAEVPCIRLDHLNDEQRKAYTLAHNKVAESDFDWDMIELELEDINIDMEQFGFEFVDEEEEREKDYKHQELRTDYFQKINKFDPTRCEGKYQMPTLEPCDFIPTKMIGFNYAMSSTDYNSTIHFYLDDYQFERVWNQPDKYIEILSKYEAVLTPSFSLYNDMALSIKIYNTFRSRLLGQMMQDYGLNVIPIVYWNYEDSYEYCFDGLPENATLSIYTMGIKNKETHEMDKKALDELIKRKHPKRLLIYGNGLKHDYDFGDIEVIYYKNEVTERMKKLRGDK
jgi:hypothetical protein